MLERQKWMRDINRIGFAGFGAEIFYFYFKFIFLTQRGTLPNVYFKPGRKPVCTEKTKIKAKASRKNWDARHP